MPSRGCPSGVLTLPVTLGAPATAFTGTAWSRVALPPVAMVAAVAQMEPLRPLTQVTLPSLVQSITNARRSPRPSAYATMPAACMALRLLESYLLPPAPAYTLPWLMHSRT